MSKAFTSEESEALPGAVRAPPQGETRPITPRGYGELLTKLKQARTERDAAEREAKAGVLDAAARYATLGQQAALLEGTLATVAVVQPTADLSLTAFGHAVLVRDEAGARHRYVLVGPDEAEPKRGRISAASPLGKALLGLRQGEEAEVQRPRGTALLTVEQILPE
jgi:transcription elongation factor GreB